MGLASPSQSRRLQNWRDFVLRLQIGLEPGRTGCASCSEVNAFKRSRQPKTSIYGIICHLLDTAQRTTKYIWTSCWINVVASPSYIFTPPPEQMSVDVNLLLCPQCMYSLFESKDADLTGNMSAVYPPTPILTFRPNDEHSKEEWERV